MTWRDWLLFLGWMASMAILFTAYVLVTRRVNRERDEAIHAGAVSVYGYMPVPSMNVSSRPAGVTTMRCAHMALSGATEASCGICGPLTAAASRG